MSIIALSAIVALLYFGRVLLITLVISVIIAFILDPFVGFVMRTRLPRGAAAFVVCSISLLALYLVGLGAYSQLDSLSEDLPLYSQRANELVDAIATRVEGIEQKAYQLFIPKRFQERDRVQQQAQPPETPRKRRQQQQQAQQVKVDPNAPPPVQEVRIRSERASFVQYAYEYFHAYYTVLLMISFVPFLVYFMLSWRDHIRKSFLSMFEGEGRVVAGRSWQSIADLARAYVVGNFILGLLLSIASAICFWSWSLPYWMIVGPISGFLSLVPYVGLPLAIAPAMVAALAQYTTVTPYLVIAATVAFFHLLALNLLYPKMVGGRVHLNPLTVTVALMFWGTLWGGVGLVLAIPITAAVKAVFDNVESLRAYGRLLGD